MFSSMKACDIKMKDLEDENPSEADVCRPHSG